MLSKIGRAVLVLLRIICFLSLLVVSTSVGFPIVTLNADLCHGLELVITCTDPTITRLANQAMGVILISAFTGLPVLLALGAIGFLIYDIIRWRRRRAV